MTEQNETETIFACIAQHGPLSIDAIAQQTGYHRHLVQMVVFLAQGKGLLRQAGEAPDGEPTYKKPDKYRFTPEEEATQRLHFTGHRDKDTVITEWGIPGFVRLQVQHAWQGVLGIAQRVYSEEEYAYCFQRNLTLQDITLMLEQIRHDIEYDKAAHGAGQTESEE